MSHVGAVLVVDSHWNTLQWWAVLVLPSERKARRTRVEKFKGPLRGDSPVAPVGVGGGNCALGPVEFREQH